MNTIIEFTCLPYCNFILNVSIGPVLLNFPIVVKDPSRKTKLLVGMDLVCADSFARQCNMYRGRTRANPPNLQTFRLVFDSAGAWLHEYVSPSERR